MPMQESKLVESAKQGDPSAFDDLVNAHRDRVYRSLIKACGNQETAQDVLQEALINAFRALKSFRGDSQFGTWLYAIARRLCIRTRKKLDLFFSMDDPLNTEEGQQILRQIMDEQAKNPELMVIENELKERVHNAIHSLPENLRQVIILRDMEGYSTEETAKKLNLTLAAVKARLHRAREQVREVIEHYLQEEG